MYVPRLFFAKYRQPKKQARKRCIGHFTRVEKKWELSSLSWEQDWDKEKKRGKKGDWSCERACVREREREWEIAEIASRPLGRWVTTEMKNGYDEKMRLFSF